MPILEFLQWSPGKWRHKLSRILHDCIASAGSRSWRHLHWVCKMGAGWVTFSSVQMCKWAMRFQGNQMSSSPLSDRQGFAVYRTCYHCGFWFAVLQIGSRCVCIFHQMGCLSIFDWPPWHVARWEIIFLLPFLRRLSPRVIKKHIPLYRGFVNVWPSV